MARTMWFLVAGGGSCLALLLGAVTSGAAPAAASAHETARDRALTQRQQSSAARYRLPKRYLGSIEGSRVEEDGAGNTWTATWRGTISLERRPGQRGSYVARGTVTYSVHGTVSGQTGTCPYSDSGSLPLMGSLDIYRGKREYILGVGPAEGQVTVIADCPLFIDEDGDQFGGPTPYYVDCPCGAGRLITYRVRNFSSIRGTFRSEGMNPGPYTQSETWSLTGVVTEGRPRAEPGGPYAAIRVGNVVLDGSASRGKLREYRWTFAPAEGCPQGSRLSRSAESRVRIRIRVLCSLRATLTVTDVRGRRDSRFTVIEVKPRTLGWATPVNHREELETDPGYPPPRWSFADDGQTINGDAIFGLNASGCSSAIEDMICPRPNSSGTWSGAGFELDRVSPNEKGPFAGWYYVKTTNLSIERVAVYNGWIWRSSRRDPEPQPGGAPMNFYDFNLRQGLGVESFLFWLRAHEGWGFHNKPRTGHTKAILEYVRDDPQRNDPRTLLERIVDSQSDSLIKRADQDLGILDIEIYHAARDPLNEMWSHGVWAWSPTEREWARIAVGS